MLPGRFTLLLCCGLLARPRVARADIITVYETRCIEDLLSLSPSSSSAVFGTSASASASSSIISPPGSVSPDGLCGGSFQCRGSPFGACCGANSRCADTAAACGPGCQSAFGLCPVPGTVPSNDGSCGPVALKSCLGSGRGACCSQWGYCGAGSDYCGTGCQPGYGYCGAVPPPVSFSFSLTQSSSQSLAPAPTVSGSVYTPPESSGVSTSLSSSSVGASSGTANSGTVSLANSEGSASSTTQVVSSVLVTPVPATSSFSSTLFPSFSLISASSSTPGSTPLPSSLSAASSSASSLPAAPFGACGSNNGGVVCSTSLSAPCCSQFGFCGNDTQYCGFGCQSGFGQCLQVSEDVEISRAPTNLISTATQSQSASSTLAVGAAPTNLACPQDDGKAVFLAGRRFTLMCFREPYGGNLPNQPLYSPNLVFCGQICSLTNGCATASQVGTFCYLKSTNTGFVNSGGNALVVLPADNPPPPVNNPGAPSSSVAPSSSSSIGAAACGTGSASPTLHLASPTPLLSTDVFNNYDDEVRNLTLPFPMQLYGESARTLFVSTNGVLSFGPTIAYAPKLLPSTELPPYSVAPLWSDMVLPFQEASDGIWYEVDPVAQTVNVEWILGSAGDIYSLHQFQVRYEARLPNIVRFSYFTVAGNGVGASIGAQGNGVAAQFAYNQRLLCPGTVVTCDTIANRCRNGTDTS